MVYLRVILSMLFFFFFQAEDGIRDIGVTGVQTCALPIYLVCFPLVHAQDPDASVEGGDAEGVARLTRLSQRTADKLRASLLLPEWGFQPRDSPGGSARGL